MTNRRLERSTGTVADKLADTLRDQILAGDFQPGDRLPGEQKLADENGLSRDTVRRALGRLEREGLVQTSGRVRYVRKYDLLKWAPGTFESPTHRRDTIERGQDAWASDVSMQGREPLQDVQVAIVHAPTVVAEQLNIEPETTVVMRQRRRDVDGVPWQLADSYYPRDVAEGTAIMEPGDKFVSGGLMKAAGHEQFRFHDEIRVRMPTREESTRLELPPLTPVAEHVRTGYNKDDRPVRVIITIAPGDRHIIIYDIDAPPSKETQ